VKIGDKVFIALPTAPTLASGVIITKKLAFKHYVIPQWLYVVRKAPGETSIADTLNLIMTGNAGNLYGVSSRYLFKYPDTLTDGGLEQCQHHSKAA
jgi:hypothetical protein